MSDRKDINELKVGSIIFWQRYGTHWRIDRVGLVDRLVDATYIHMKDRACDKFVGSIRFDNDDLFKEAIPLACPKHAYLLDRA